MRLTVPAPAARLLAFVFVACVAHAALQQQYYMRCRSSILRILLYGNSSMCTNMHAILEQVETGMLGLVPQMVAGTLQPWLGDMLAVVQALVGGALQQ